ncbi:hypothetical protein RB653_006165 [Dictyostelium firmibasis]|uniref:Cell fusion related protein n=1 Tax=Dictyostelium firmibasis TaxID=79012 RepID=A0AAN7U9B1_9MYCE
MGKKQNFYFFALIIISIVIFNNNIFIKSTTIDVGPTIDLGCLSYSVEPPSGTIILNPNSFELMLEFNLNPIYIRLSNGDLSKTTLLSDSELLLLIKYQDITGLPVFNFWDKITNKTYLPNSTTTKGVDNRIWLNFINLPISNSLYFQSNIGIVSGSYWIGARSINVYSSNSVAPPKLEINPFFSSCPISKRSEVAWDFNNPSSSQIYPTTLKAELCSSIDNTITSGNNICKLNQRFYYSLVLPVSIGKGIVSTVLNTITYQGFQYKFKDYPITIESKQDISVSIPFNYLKSYTPPYEVQLSSNPENAPFQDLNIIDPKTLDNFISLYNSGYYNQVLYGNSNNFNIFNMNSSVDSKFLIENYENEFIFKSTKNNLVKEIYILISDKESYQFYKDFIECSQNSLRNSFTVNHGKTTFHSLAFLNLFRSYNFSLENLKIIRDLQINLGSNSKAIKIQMNNSNSKSDYYIANDLLVGVSVEFTVSSNQYQSLGNSLLFVPGSSSSSSSSSNISTRYALILPKSSVGNGMNQIGLDIEDWYKQIGFCNLEHGSNSKNQIQNYIQDGGYTFDLMIPNWVSVGGQDQNQDRTTINTSSSELLMKFNSNQASFKVYFGGFDFFEPMIHSDNLTVSSIPGTMVGKECYGQFQFDIINFGKESSIVNFDINCFQDVYLEIVNYAQTIPGDSNQKRSFFVNVAIEKFYKSSMIQCNVSMWIDVNNRPLWSTVNKSFKKFIEIPIFKGCNILDPCLDINTQPIVSQVSPLIKFGDWNNLGNFLNSIPISIEINNIGNGTGDFISTLHCISNILDVNVNFFMLNDKNYIVTKGLEKSKTSIVQFLLYGESSAIDGIQLQCKIITKLYNPNTICWPNYNQENSVSFNLLYPYDKCVVIYNTGQEPLIEFNLEQYSNGNAVPKYSFDYSQWLPSMDSDPLPKKHRLKVIENPLNKNSIRYGTVDQTVLYSEFTLIKVKNGGGKSGEFTVTIGNCSDEVYVWTQGITTIIPSGQIRTFYFQIFSYPTNIKAYSIGCQLSIITDRQECYSDLGKSFSQDPILVYPYYSQCAGNWLEPSLFKPLSFWDENPLNNSIDLSNLNFKIGKWNFYQGNNTKQLPNFYYQDLSLEVVNVEYGNGNVFSSLICNDVSLTTYTINNTKKSSCFISENSSCYLGWRIISLPTTTDQALQDIIDCNLLIEIKDSEEPNLSCWTNSGKSIKTSFKLSKYINPCIDGAYDEVFISTTTNKFEIYSSDWGLKTDINNNYFNFNYFLNGNSSIESTNSIIYYSYKNIMIQNTGNGNGLIKSLIQINNPSVFLILNESIIECEIQLNSYCTFTFLFGLIPNRFSSTPPSSSFQNFNELEINIKFLVLPKLCWSTIGKTIEIIIISKLPNLPCGWDPLSSTNISIQYTTPPQVSLIYPNQYIIGNLNYYQNSNDPLNLRFSNWYKFYNDENFNQTQNSLNQQQHYYSINLTGHIYNMGDGGGVVVFRLACDNGNGTKKQFVSIMNDEIVSYIPPGSYYNFKFKIIVSDKSPFSSNSKVNEMVMCKVSSIVNLEKCWNPYGKSVIQYIQLPFDSKITNVTTTTLPIFSNEKNDKLTLLSTLLPISLIIFLILLYFIIKYYKYLLIKFNGFIISSHQNKLFKQPLVIKEVNNDDQKEIDSNVVAVSSLGKCGCGENLRYHCIKCPSSISNYCESPQCKNLIHSATLNNITHQHEPNLIKQPWIDLFEFEPNSKVVEDLILNKLKKFKSK